LIKVTIDSALEAGFLLTAALCRQELQASAMLFLSENWQTWPWPNAY